MPGSVQQACADPAHPPRARKERAIEHNDRPLGVGIVGCGDIFQRYVRGLRQFPELRIVRCADILPDRAARAASEQAIPATGSTDELLQDPAVDLVLNLTPPLAHAHVSLAAIEAGKHVYTEKPLAADLADAARLVTRAAQRGVRIGTAPDTFLGRSCQMALQAIQAGDIGEVIGATAFVRHSRAERWHPDPGFLFRPGGGPVLDLGPYTLTQLVACLGPVREVAATSRVGAPERTVITPGVPSHTIRVEVPTHAGALLRFASGVIATVVMSFDIWQTDLPFVEIYGTRGTLSLPNPAKFTGEARIRRHDDDDWWVPAAPTAPVTSQQYTRGLGVADLARSLACGRPHRATADLGLHVLEVLRAIEDAGPTTVQMIDSTCERPPALAPSEGEPCPTTA
ncbi:Gfo/Idh/MocA family oxidoreductase [Streptomyces sp. NPDC052020]|uniref:Gfo/Idh/MocA family protein n=1 Tax=Streptomyces sp. NPDC052020 TaxID=3155677 RepID=UPI003425FE69